MATILGAIFIFLLVVALHEFGHFSVAKLVGIKVNEFSIGMGPNIFNRQKGETKYSLRALPIGGYVAMEGEEEDSNHPRSFNNAPLWGRIAVVLAGATMNFILAVLAFILAFSIMGFYSTKIQDVVVDSPAMKAGIMAGDKILSVNNEKVSSWEDVVSFISKSKTEVSIGVERSGENLDFKLMPIEEEGRSIIGIKPEVERSLTKAIKMSFLMTGKVIVSIFSVFKLIFQGNFKMNMLSGPIGVISLIGESTAQGFGSLIFMLGIISANLGVINLLPIPALDGGKVVFLLIEALRGKPISRDKEATITMVGIVFLIGLMLYVTIFSDLTRILNR